MTDTRQPDTSVDLETLSATPPGNAHGIPRSLWFITAAWGCLLIGASLVWPMTYGYDETLHVDMAYAYADKPLHFYGPGKLNISQSTLGIYQLVPGHPPKKRLAEVPTAARGDRPTLSQLGGHAPTAGPPDQMVQHPPLYYEMAALVLHIPGVSHTAWDTQVWLMRLLSVALMLPVPLLCWGAARRLLKVSLPRGTLPSTVTRLSIAAAVIPFTLPNLIRDGSSVTNDALLISAVSYLMYLLCRVVTSDFTKRTAVGISIALAVALLTKGFALVLPPIILGAYLIGWFRSPRETRGGWSVLVHLIAITAAGGVLGGLWWLRNLVLYGSIQPLGRPPLMPLEGGTDLAGHVRRFVPRFTTDLSERIWGGVGYADVPGIAGTVTFGFLIVVVIGLLISPLSGGTRGSRRANVFLLMSLTLTFLVVAGGSFSHYRHDPLSKVPGASQGRYLYQTIVIVAALATIGWFAVLQPRVRSIVAPVVLASGILLNAAVWIMLLRSWYAPATHVSFARKTLNGVHALLRFSPSPSGVTILFVVVLPVLSCATALAAVIRETRLLRQTNDPAVSPEPASHGTNEMLTPSVV